MEREEPRELELSLLALFDPVIDRSSDGLLVLFPENYLIIIFPTVYCHLSSLPDSSARTAMT